MAWERAEDGGGVCAGKGRARSVGRGFIAGGASVRHRARGMRRRTHAQLTGESGSFQVGTEAGKDGEVARLMLTSSLVRR